MQVVVSAEVKAGCWFTVKVKVAGEDREARDAMIGELAEKADAALVQRIGHTAVLYRPSKERRQIVLPRG